jgi:ornithine cyclodeaminase
MRFVGADEVHELCGWKELMAALAEFHRGPIPLVDRSELHHNAEGGVRQTYFNLPAWLPGQFLGTKCVTVFPANRSLPSVQALYVLFDGADGEPLAVFDATAMTYRKTAADSALGSELLSRRDSQVLLMVGAGALAPYLVAAHRAVRPSISRVLVWNRTRGRAFSMGEEVEDLELAVPTADIVCCATASTSPLVMGSWLRPGTHLDLVGAFAPDMRECDDEAVLRARLFVDSRMFAVDQPGDLGNPLRRGVIRADAVEADLFELCSGAYRLTRTDDDITLFKNGGGAHLDLFTAMHMWRIFSGGGRGA